MSKGAHPPTNLNQTPNTGMIGSAVRLWGISFIVERETTQTTN